MNWCVWRAIVPLPCFPEFASTLLRYGGPTPLRKNEAPRFIFHREVRVDSVFGIFFGALAIIAFGACIGAGLRGRPGRLFGLAILKIGLACLFVLLLFVDSFPHNEIILWLVLMLMAGALICFGGACWLAARSMGKDDEPPGQD